MVDRKAVRFGVKYGKFVLMYERVVEKEPKKQIENTELKRLTINTYA